MLDCMCDVEIIAMNDKDEVSIGAVPEDYPRRLPGFRPRSVGFHARTGGYVLHGSRLSHALFIMITGPANVDVADKILSNEQG